MGDTNLARAVVLLALGLLGAIALVIYRIAPNRSASTPLADTTAIGNPSVRTDAGPHSFDEMLTDLMD